MDKALVFGTKDCRFESCQGHCIIFVQIHLVCNKTFLSYCSTAFELVVKTVWPSGLRRWLKAPFRKGVGSNPTAVIMISAFTFGCHDQDLACVYVFGLKKLL